MIIIVRKVVIPIKVKEVLELLQISRPTLTKYVKEGGIMNGEDGS